MYKEYNWLHYLLFTRSALTRAVREITSGQRCSRESVPRRKLDNVNKLMERGLIFRSLSRRGDSRKFPRAEWPKLISRTPSVHVLCKGKPSELYERGRSGLLIPLAVSPRASFVRAKGTSRAIIEYHAIFRHVNDPQIPYPPNDDDSLLARKYRDK